MLTFVGVCALNIMHSAANQEKNFLMFARNQAVEFSFDDSR
jgi:hypothetical protein